MAEERLSAKNDSCPTATSESVNSFLQVSESVKRRAQECKVDGIGFKLGKQVVGVRFINFIMNTGILLGKAAQPAKRVRTD